MGFRRANYLKMSIKVGLHWLQFTMPEKVKIEDTLSELSYYVPSNYIAAKNGMLGYQNQLIGMGSSRILSSDIDNEIEMRSPKDVMATSRLLSSRERPEHHVILPGRWLDCLDERSSCILEWILEKEGHLTRLDIAGDDTDKRVRPRDLKKFCEEGQLVTHYKTVWLHDNIMGGRGSTIYFGSSSSDRRIRVYDKDIESGGMNDSVRWEIQLRNEMADKGASHILHSKSFGDAFKSTLVDMIDFREKNTIETEKRKRTKWFNSIVEDAKKADYTIPSSLITIESMEKWLEKQVAPSLAAVTTAKGGDLSYIESIIEKGRKRLSRAQQTAIAEHIFNRLPA